MPRGPDGSVQQNHGRPFVTQMDGDQHARVRRGLPLPAFSSRRIAQLQESIRGQDRRRHARQRRSQRTAIRWHAGLHGAHLVVYALLDAMINMERPRKAIFVQFHDLHTTGTTTSNQVRHNSLNCGRPSIVPWKRSGIHHRRAPGQPAFRLHQRSGQCPRSRRQAQRSRTVRSDFFGICEASLSATSRAAGGVLLFYLIYTARRPERGIRSRSRASFPMQSKSACISVATAISPSRASPRATPRSVRHVRKGPWCVLRHFDPNYDPEVLRDPLRFDIHRKPQRIMSLGSGPHHCIGNTYGRSTISIAITQPAGTISRGEAARSRFSNRSAAAPSGNCDCRTCQ